MKSAPAQRDTGILAVSALGLFPRLLFYFLFVAAIPLAIVSLRADLDARKVLADGRTSQLSGLAASLSRALDTYLDERQQSVVKLGSIPAIQQLAREGTWDESRNRQQVLDLMRAVVQGGQEEALALVDRSGTVRLTTDAPLQGKSLGQQPEVRSALSGTAATGDVLADGAGPSRPSLHIAVPVGSGSALVLRLSPLTMWSLMQDARVGQTGYSLLVDEHGLVIGHSSDPSTLFTPYSPQSVAQASPAAAQGRVMDMATDAVRALQLDELISTDALGHGRAVATHRLAARPWIVVVAQDEAEAFQPLATLRATTTTVGGFALLAAAVIATVLALSIATPIRRMRDVLQAAGTGDLTRRMHLQQKDELGQLSAQVDLTLDKLSTLVTHAGTAADAASATSANVAAATQQQAAAMAEISATIEELARSAEQVAESAERAFKAAESARGGVAEGVESLDRIKERSDLLAERLASLAERSVRIGDVADLIGEITNKTHLLSVNAAIEAATAGEFGRRFAVVAQQVKELADETRTAAGEVKSLIRQTQTAASSAVVASEGVSREVGLGVEVAREADRAIDQVVHQVRTISLATQQQLTANRQVADAVVGTTDAVRQVADSLGGLESQIARLRARVEELRTGKVMITSPAEDGAPATVAANDLAPTRPVPAT